MSDLHRVNRNAMPESDGMFFDTWGGLDDLLNCGVLVPVEDETLNTLAKLLDAGYEWSQLIPRLMDLPPNAALYTKPKNLRHDLSNRDNHCLNPGCSQIGGVWCDGFVQVLPKGTSQ